MPLRSLLTIASSDESTMAPSRLSSAFRALDACYVAGNLRGADNGDRWCLGSATRSARSGPACRPSAAGCFRNARFARPLRTRRSTRLPPPSDRRDDLPDRLADDLCAVKPNSRSAAGFHDCTIPSRSLLTMASSDDWTTAREMCSAALTRLAFADIPKNVRRPTIWPAHCESATA